MLQVHPLILQNGRHQHILNVFMLSEGEASSPQVQVLMNSVELRYYY